ncbi:female-specific protein transformer isoform X2 [Folsomia candida]|uniref:female-specific protein transformer isoform X2 n=1 Tax=Folsomia candida TaxID=158441 RepID=UPI000B8F9F6C|nr:female-specific protein transformer isoform X2 [Folsomia candida]
MSHRQHHLGRGGRANPVGAVPQAPPPPVLSNSRQGGRPSSNRRSSRSRSPHDRSRSSGGNRYAGRLPGREEAERARGRPMRQSRSRSSSPIASNSINVPSTAAYRGIKSSLPHSVLNHSLPPPIKQQSISLITEDGTFPIIRRILDPDDVKIPRRSGEGARPIFERDELKEGMRRRFASDGDEGHNRSPPVLQHPSQRVMIIHDPTASNRGDSFRLPPVVTKDLEFRGSRNLQPITTSGQHRDFRPSNYQHRSMSPPSRDRDMRGERGPSSVMRRGDRSRDIITVRGERIREEGLHPPHIRSRSKDRTERPSHHSRSPVRVLRDRERVSRSLSRTPPPMPPEMRRRMIERERDLRSKLSRPAGRFPAKFDTNHDSRIGEPSSSSFRGRGRGFLRGGRGGFREENRSRGHTWEHDLFEREDNLDADLKSSKV